jgi:hypothetical protein
MILQRLRASRLLRLGALCLLLAVLVGCGRRAWPEPKVSEDRFRWRAVTAQRMGECVVVDCELAGAWKNVESLRLMLEPIGDGPGDGCATCPFVPRITRVYSLSAPEVRRDMNRLVITVCGLEPGKTYRVQLLLNNTYHILQPVVSEPLLAAPQ